MKSIEERFWPRVAKSDGCWLWTGCKGGRPGGNLYGTIYFNRKQTKTHRVAWILTNGPIPDGLFVCHKCDVPLCVNPDHLFLGTASDNMRDCFAKGRMSNNDERLRMAWEANRNTTHCRRGHEFTPETTMLRPSGNRECRTCINLRKRAVRASRRAA